MRTRIAKILIAFILGAISFVLFIGIGEVLVWHLGAAGFVPTLLLMAGYFFLCQSLLSRGNPDAIREDVPLMLALGAIPLLLVVVMIFAESWGTILVQGGGMVVACGGGIVAGALAASKLARRKVKARKDTA
jgi:hypothetical protein